jgi:hypothetical protein
MFSGLSLTLPVFFIFIIYIYFRALIMPRHERHGRSKSLTISAERASDQDLEWGQIMEISFFVSVRWQYLSVQEGLINRPNCFYPFFAYEIEVRSPSGSSDPESIGNSLKANDELSSRFPFRVALSELFDGNLSRPAARPSLSFRRAGRRGRIWRARSTRRRNEGREAVHVGREDALDLLVHEQPG